jgi:hypothetical protein
MQTRRLPKTVSVLFIISYAILIHLFIFSMVKFGRFSLYVTPIGCFLTAVCHVTLVILSKRKIESYSTAVDPNITNQLATSAYPPAPQGPEMPTKRGQFAECHGPAYPSHTISIANCTIVLLLALLWAASIVCHSSGCSGEKSRTAHDIGSFLYLKERLGMSIRVSCSPCSASSFIIEDIIFETVRYPYE